jgi:predicted nucleic acid-binding protein
LPKRPRSSTSCAPTPRSQQIIQDNAAAICGVTLAEVYAGAKNAADIALFAAALGVFGRVAIPDSIWEMLGRSLSLLRTHGIAVPFPDALIATVAIQLQLELWTNDAHFLMIQSVLPQLKLCQEPP